MAFDGSSEGKPERSVPTRRRAYCARERSVADRARLCLWPLCFEDLLAVEKAEEPLSPRDPDEVPKRGGGSLQTLADLEGKRRLESFGVVLTGNSTAPLGGVQHLSRPRERFLYVVSAPGPYACEQRVALDLQDDGTASRFLHIPDL